MEKLISRDISCLVYHLHQTSIFYSNWMPIEEFATPVCFKLEIIIFWIFFSVFPFVCKEASLSVLSLHFLKSVLRLNHLSSQTLQMWVLFKKCLVFDRIYLSNKEGEVASILCWLITTIVTENRVNFVK